MNPTELRTLVFQPTLAPKVVNALTLQVKNVVNTGLYLVRQVLSAYVYDPVTKTHTQQVQHKAQTKVIAHFNQTIDRVNAGRQAKLKAGEEWKPLPSLQTTQKNSPASILQITVLDNALRTWKNGRRKPVYGRLPAVLAQASVWRVKDMFSGYYKSLASFRKNPGTRGRPGLPGYYGKHDRCGFELPYASFPGRFPKIQKIPTDYAETTTLTPADVQAFLAVPLCAEVKTACDRRGWKSYEIRTLRCVVTKTSHRWEVVVRIPTVATWASTRGIAKDALAEYVKALPIAALPRMAGIDPGMSSLTTVAFSTGHKAMVVPGKDYLKEMERSQTMLNTYVSTHTTPRAKELQGMKNAHREAGTSFPRNLRIELATELQAAYTPEYHQKMQRRNQGANDYVHKLTTGIVRKLLENNVELLVLSHNDGWKQECNLGTDNNRKFHMIAHTKIVELLTYKAEAVGISVLVTEESYTSQSSFVQNDPLPTYTPPVPTPAVIPPVPTLAAGTPPTAPAVVPQAFTGHRSKDRNWFHNSTRTDRWLYVHADVNGAFNALRKVAPSFAYSTAVTLKFHCYAVRNCGPVLLPFHRLPTRGKRGLKVI